MPIGPEDELKTHVSSVLSANYELENEIGRGGMGVVYCARDRRLKRSVAVKVLPPELGYRSDIRQRFLREAETAAQLNHPNIVPIYTVEEKDNLVYFVMAFISGDNLGKVITERGAMDPDDVRRILREVSDALAYAHHRNVIHRDIKPDNILIDADSGRAMVTDFGIARALTESSDSRLTATGMAIGTPAYMSPEQSAGDSQIDGRSDLYSLGVVGYQMLCGELPFDAPNTPMMLVKHLSEVPVSVNERMPGIPLDLSRAVMMCLEKNPADRFPNATALSTALSTGDIPTLIARAQPSPQRSSSMGSIGGGSLGSARPGAAMPSLRTQQAVSPPIEMPTRYSSGSRAAATNDDYKRWNAPPVVKFRRRLAPYLAVNAVLIPAGIFGSNGFFFATIWWTVAMAVQYSKLWQSGYDWRDVFRQPRDRLFVDVAAETIDDARALFDEKKREQVRARARRRTGTGGLFSPVPPNLPPMPAPVGRLGGGMHRNQPGNGVDYPAVNSRYAGTVQQAASDRDEIQRHLNQLGEGERSNVPDVSQAADALFLKIRQLAARLDEIDGSGEQPSEVELEREITKLEDQANPLDFNASESRVRRLAQLKRQRRIVIDLARKREEAAGKLENCRMLLRSMKLELLRYRSAGLGGPATGLTMVTQQVQSVVRDLGYLSDAAAEVKAL
jgi:serine/threonine protein kinase